MISDSAYKGLPLARFESMSDEERVRNLLLRPSSASSMIAHGHQVIGGSRLNAAIGCRRNFSQPYANWDLRTRGCFDKYTGRWFDCQPDAWKSA